MVAGVGRWGISGSGSSVGHAFEEEFEGALGPVGAELGGRGDEAVLGVMGDLGDDLGGWLGGVRFGQVEAGDLEAVEEQAGAAGVDVVGGDAAEDFSDGLLDRGTVLGVGEGEAGLAAVAGGGVLDGAAGVVVEVAEGLVLSERLSGPRMAGLPQRRPSAKMWRHWKRVDSVSGVMISGVMQAYPSPGFLRKI